MSDPAGGLTFRAMAAADFPTMTAWLAMPHVKAFYQPKPISLDEVCAHYGPRLAEDWPTRCHIAESHGRPFAYLQCYRNADWPDWEAETGVAGGLSIDLYIGEPAFVGRGYGQAMLRGYVRDVVFPRWPDEPVCYIAHAVANTRALACSQAVGFRDIGRFEEDGVPMRLLVLGRDQSSSR
ncbi:MAG TPA: GNAT family N-acetyltransferase [Caulobacteraceae bacterium]|nr:GNAT family N-acetyltransferase [Caulobacteraceae bacterium]